MNYSLGNMLSRGGRVAFNPLSLSPALWLSDTGSNPAQWDDLSGNDRHATQAIGTNQPAIIASALNGRQVRRFDGVDDFLETAAVSIAQPYTTYVVYRCTAIGQQIVVAGSNVATTAGGVNLIIHRSASDNSGINAGTLYGPFSVNTSWQIFGTLANGASSRVYRNGVMSAAGDAGTNSISLLRIGRSSLAAYFNGDIAEVLVFPAALSAENRRRIEGYLSVKYNIALS
jgi:hypothetical protein